MSKGGGGPYAGCFLDGFEVVCKHTDLTFDAIKQMTCFLEEAGGLQRDYAGRMTALCKKYSERRLPQFEGTAQTAVQTVVKELDAMASASQEFVKQMAILKKDALTFIKQKQKQKKLLENNYQKIVKEMRNQHDRLQKAHNNYEKLARDANDKQQAIAKKESDPAFKQGSTQSMRNKAKQAAEKAQKAEKDYKDVLGKTNDKQKVHYEEEQPTVLTQYQHLEEDVIMYIKDLLKQYAGYVSGMQMPDRWRESHNHICCAVDHIDQSKDTTAFAEKNKNGKCVPPPIVCASFPVAPIPDPPPPPPEPVVAVVVPVAAPPPPPRDSTPKSQQDKQPNDKEQDKQMKNKEQDKQSPKDKEKKVTNNQAKEQPKEQPKASKAAPAAAAASSSAAASNAAAGHAHSKSEMPRQQQQQQQVVQRTSQQQKRMSQFTAPDRDPPHPAPEQLDDYQQRSVEALPRQSRSGVAAVGASAAGAAAGAAVGATSAEVLAQDTPEEPAPEPPANNGEQARALYDFKPADENDLSLVAGDLVFVLERDDTGWCYATDGHKEGYVPSKYLQILDSPTEPQPDALAS
eukprot:TRINITY_DN91_c1_g1_i1.p1 TRINITY_DN91_c1_g1~~TRINITY_DN91_c1_g1_i1.p1  ORF type:complete len:572 (-),score=195.24 TRINITY_DN91_c1_g1_i1:77-1792(-)